MRSLKTDFRISRFVIGKILVFSITAFACVLAAFPNQFEMEHPGYRAWLLLFISWLILSVVFFWLWENVASPTLSLQTRQGKSAIIGFSIVFSILLVFMVPIKLNRYFYFLLPVHTLEIQSIDGRKDAVDVLSFKADWGDLPAGKTNLPYSWTGKPGPQAILAFNPDVNKHPIRVIWDGKPEIVDISTGVKKNGVLVTNNFDIPILQTILIAFFLLIGLVSAVFWITILITSIQKLPGKPKPVNLFLLALPMLSVWTIYLLTFWPGLSSYDTIQQWGEARAGVFTDAHPALDTMFIALVSHIINSLAAVAFIQILALALVAAWGLVELNKRGLPGWAVWGLSFGFALLPVNSLIVITVWKDVLYGVAIFAFVIQIVKIVFSDGDWLMSKTNLAGLILTGLAASFLRHNGFPFIVVTLAVFILPYRKRWKNLSSAILIITSIVLLIQGPFYDFMRVKKYPAFINILLFEHIGAHIKAGTPLEQSDQAYLNNLIPIGKWPYFCYNSIIRNMDGPIPFDTFTIPDARPAQIAFNLFIKDPKVDLVHTLCAGGLIWQVNPGYPIYTLPMANRNYGQPNDLGITSHPLLPDLLNVLPVPPSDDPLSWRPAFYLLVFSFLVTLLAIRARSMKYLWILVPILLHSALMIAINYAPDFRYMFSTELSAIYAIGLCFIPAAGFQEKAGNKKPTGKRKSR